MSTLVRHIAVTAVMAVALLATSAGVAAACAGECAGLSCPESLRAEPVSSAERAPEARRTVTRGDAAPWAPSPYRRHAAPLDPTPVHTAHAAPVSPLRI